MVLRKNAQIYSESSAWRIVIQGIASEVIAELGGLDLAGLEVKGGLSSIRLELTVSSGLVPIRISGGASEITVMRPAGVAARVHLKGWASVFVFDDQTFSNLGNDVRLQSSGFDPTAPYFDIEIASSASMVNCTSLHQRTQPGAAICAKRSHTWAASHARILARASGSRRVAGPL